MNVLFAHDHKFRLKDGRYYSGGGLPDKVLSRYIEHPGELSVIARVVPVQKGDTELSLISNPNIKIYNYYQKGISMKELVRKSDLIVVRLPSIIGILTIIQSILQKKKYMIELVGCPRDSYKYHGSSLGKLVSPIMSIVTKWLVKNSEYVLYVSQWFLQKRYPTKGLSVACPDVFLKEPNEQVLINRLTKIDNLKEKKTLKLGLIGSLSVSYRGHSTAIKALDLLKRQGVSCQLYFLGGGSKKNWIEYSRKYDVENSVIYSGTLPSGEPVLNWIDEMDILIMPTQAETLGRAIIEAMSRACPVLGSVETAIGEQIGSDCLFYAEDYIRLASLIKRMINDTDYMRYCAYENFYRSFKYSNKQTDKIRNEFFRIYKERVYEEKLGGN